MSAPKPFMPKPSRTTKQLWIIRGSAVAGAILILLAGCWAITNTQYPAPPQNPEAPVTKILTLFAYNTSKHTSDPIPGCWYDAGDYVTFLPHQAVATLYLQKARTAATQRQTQAALDDVINQSISCLRPAMAENWKQFRDQTSHGVNLPPWLHQRIYPQHTAKTRPNEGWDFWRLWAAIIEDERTAAADAYAYSKTLAEEVTSSNCCEGGPLTIMEGNANDIWGASPAALDALEKNPASIRNLLTELAADPNPTSRFHYWGGNRDIAGTVALERLYARKTGDEQFKPLSEHLVAFLNGDNPWKIPFTNDPKLYHPCRFFRACPTNGILAAGLDLSNPSEPWRMHEPTLITQATYVLAMVLWNNW